VLLTCQTLVLQPVIYVLLQVSALEEDVLSYELTTHCLTSHATTTGGFAAMIMPAPAATLPASAGVTQSFLRYVYSNIVVKHAVLYARKVQYKR
jgi:hypothetical protein